MAHQPLKTAMIGLRHGHVGKLDPDNSKPGYAHTLKALSDIQVVAYCEDTDPQLLESAKKFDPGAHLYTSVDDLIAREDFDLAWVILPANEIPGTGIKLAEAGKHFYMEKQFARTAADLAQMVRAVRKSGVKVCSGYPWRFHPAMQELKQIIDGGLLGKPMSIESRVVTTQVRPGSRDPNGFLYRNATEGGGILHMLGGHYLEVMRFLMGCDVKAVQAMTGRPVGIIEEPLEDLAIAALEYENGAFGSISAGYLYPPVAGHSDYTMTYRGREGWANWTMGAPKLEVKGTAAELSQVPNGIHEYASEPYYGYMGEAWFLRLMERFIAEIRGEGGPGVTAEDALRVLQTIEAVYESARTGRRVEVQYGV